MVVDALVIGGGPAGSTAALLVARAGFSVVLLERKQFPRRKVCGEYLSCTNWKLLKALGADDQFLREAGPEVRTVGLMVGRTLLNAPLPPPADARDGWGRALSRERLDTLLLSSAAAAGADVWQEHIGVHLQREGDVLQCQIRSTTGQHREIEARVVIAAHGSWDAGSLSTQLPRLPPRPGDLFGFKAHFVNSGLPAGLMPLLSFSDGYGGLVHSDAGRLSLSCCIRRDRLEHLARAGGRPAGEAVLDHILDGCCALRPVLDSATREGAWLSAGPIQPGIRMRYHDGVYIVGNAAGEAHPVVAEGISMAMQAAWLLAQRLVPARHHLHRKSARDAVGRSYSAAWHRHFAWRIRSAAAVAHWAMRPRAVMAALPLLKRCPALLTLGARFCGKASQVVAYPEAQLR